MRIRGMAGTTTSIISWQGLVYLCLYSLLVGPLGIIGVSSVCAAQEAKPCLEHLKAEGIISTFQASDEELDRSNVGGASFSCDLFVRASVAKGALEDFRAGLLEGDEARMQKALAYPLRIVLDDPTTGKTARILTITNYRDWLNIKTKEMTKEQLQVVRCASLGNVTIVGRASFNPGFIIGDGLVFFSAKSAADIRVTSIHLMEITPEMLKRACPN